MLVKYAPMPKPTLVYTISLLLTSCLPVIRAKCYSTLVIPPREISAAAAVDAVGTTPAGTPGFERWTSLHAEGTQETRLVNVLDHKAPT